MKVENLNGYANQFIIIGEEGTVFQSYDSKIALLKGDMGQQGLILYGDMWDYSATTRRHFKAFINEHTPFEYVNKAQWLKEIENNEFIEVLYNV